ncbi:hypothetical protein PSHT_10274 [Puccinia striiformis]|uniref:Uncharacterized protein n=1 Tax=Puccinia striiformis TaxID=27350 RepID=A0A2S4VB16_9BASI|nr:hypothetical protein PSHT_10274 [Puccinia striiformis]
MSSSILHHSTAATKPEIAPVTDYHVDDIATQLGRFTLNQAIPQLPVERSLPNPNPQISIKEVEEYVEEEERKAKPSTFTFSIGSDSSVTTPGLTSQNLVSSSTTSPVPPPLRGIMAELPKCIQIKACLEQFEYHRAWMRGSFPDRVLHRSTFWNSAYEQIQRIHRLTGASTLASDPVRCLWVGIIQQRRTIRVRFEELRAAHLEQRQAVWKLAVKSLYNLLTASIGFHAAKLLIIRSFLRVS